MSLMDFLSRTTNDPRSAGDILYDVVFNSDDSNGTVIGRIAAPKALIWLPIGTAIIWLLAYISGAFPYLGHYQHSSPGALASYIPTGPSHMLLFKGQEAFIDYEVESADGHPGAVAIDIRPMPAHRPTPAMIQVRGTDKGRLQVTIPQTGMYGFHHKAEAGSHREGLTYAVTWGAR